MLPSGSPLSDWLTWLETLSPKEIELGLDRVRTVLDRLGLEAAGHVLLVAGTNGKGSSVAMIDALLRKSGYTVGTYTSPHIDRYNERIAVGGAPASDARIVAAFERVEAARKEVPLTYFEYGTLAAMVVFSEAKSDVWVLEIGMGGRLDACNVIEPTASLITNVALDHCDWLGADVQAIANEKAGVMRPGVPTVFGATDVPEAMLQQAETIGAELLLAGRDFEYGHDTAGNWRWSGRATKLESLQEPGLKGRFQVGNAAAVLALLEAAGLSRSLDTALVNEVLPSIRLTGRMQSLRAGGADWLLDVAHNPAAARVLAETLDADPVDGETWAIIGLLDDKDVENIAATLDEQVTHWIAVAAHSPRAVEASELARRIANRCGRPCRISESLGNAMEFTRRNRSENDRILITGSFYLVGPALDRLELYSRPRTSWKEP